MLLDRLLQRLQGNPGLHHGNALNRVDHLNDAHPFRRKNHLVGRRVGPVNEAGETALGHNPQAVVMAPANGFRNLPGVLRPHQRQRRQGVRAQKPAERVAMSAAPSTPVSPAMARSASMVSTAELLKS